MIMKTYFRTLSSSAILACIGGLSIFTPIAMAKDSAAPTTATKTGSTSALVPIKSLKYLTVAADSKLWILKADTADNAGANVDLEFAADATLTVGIFEDHRNTKLANTALTLNAVAKDITASIPSAKLANVPANFTPPNDALCTALAVSGAGKEVLTTIVCVTQKNNWHGGVLIGYNNTLPPKQISALNLLMNTIGPTNAKTLAK